MLQFIRTHTKIFAWFFAVILIGAFGLGSISLNKHDQYAGEVFGKKVSFQEFRAFETVTRLLPPDPSILDNVETLKAYAWQQLILSREAQNQGIKVTDDAVRRQVDRILNASREGARLTPGEYANLLKSYRTTTYEFESGLREMLRIQKMLSNRFELTIDPSSIVGDESDTKEIRERAEEERKQMQSDYLEFLKDVNMRANVVDYSKLKQTENEVEANS